MAYERRTPRRRSGGAGAAVTVIIVIGLLGGLAWFGWTRLQAANKPPEELTGPRFTLRTWQRDYNLHGDVPEAGELPDPWLFAFDAGQRILKPGQEASRPSSWVHVQFEGGRFTAVQIAEYREAPGTGPYGLLEEPGFAPPAEGKQLRAFIVELSRQDDGSSLARETAGFQFFGWRKKSATALRRSLVVAARKFSPKAREIYEKARADWAAGVAGGTEGPRGPRTKFDVVLLEVGKNRDAVLAAVCEVTGLPAAEGGTLVDSAPKPVKLRATREEAESIRKKLEAAGARVEVK